MNEPHPPGPFVRNLRAIELKQLRFFARVVDIGSITRAASALHIAQPALSKQLAGLEHALGMPLLVRSPRGVLPTEQGRMLHVSLQRILRDLDAALDEVAAVGQASVGTVRLGCLETMARVVAYPLTMAMLERHPGVRLVIVTGQGRDLYRRLLAGDLDLAFLSPDDEVTGVQAKPLIDEEIFVTARSTMPGFDGEGPISMDELRELPLVLPSKSTYSIWYLLKKAFGARPMKFAEVMEADSLTLNKQLVFDGHGCGLLPWSGIQDEVESGSMRARRIENLSLFRRINLCRRPDQPVTAAAHAVADEVVNTLSRLVETGVWRHTQVAEDAGWVSV